MIRLTGEHESPLYMSMWAGTSEELRRYNKLWKYENTGIEPEEVELTKKGLLSALADLHGKCSACAHYTANHNEGQCRYCCYEKARDLNVEVNDNWKWRYEGVYLNEAND